MVNWTIETVGNEAHFIRLFVRIMRLFPVGLCSNFDGWLQRDFGEAAFA